MCLEVKYLDSRRKKVVKVMLSVVFTSPNGASLKIPCADYKMAYLLVWWRRLLKWWI
jgi:hypothetical protein